MSVTYILLDHDLDGRISAATAQLLTAARSWGEVEAVWVDGAAEVPDSVRLAAAGATRLHHVQIDPQRRWPTVVAESVVQIVGDTPVQAVVLPAVGASHDVAAHLAVRLDCAAITEVQGVTFNDSGAELTKSVLTGTWDTTITVDGPVVVTLKANAVTAIDPPVGAALPPVQHWSGQGESRVVVERSQVHVTGRPDLSTADLVIVAGRGVAGHLELVNDLADELGAAVGSTRVAVEEGWMDRDTQVGQTGVSVAPRLYIGAAVSGQVHHHGGMQASGTIVAINHDPDAPIFEYAHYGVVGDITDVLPQLTAEIRRRRSE